MPTVELLAQDADLFRRARSAKSELIDQGAIKGDREFAGTIEPGPEPVAEATVPVSEPEIAEIRIWNQNPLPQNLRQRTMWMRIRAISTS